MPVKVILVVGFCLGAFSSAQEVRQIDLTGARENRDLEAVRSGNYIICGTDEAKSAPKAVRVSVESLSPTDIHPKEHLSVVLRVENYGQVPVVLPASPQIVNLQFEAGSVRYSAMLPLMAGVSAGTIMLGWLELYGSTSKSNTTVNLKPGEWITVRGDIRVRRWYPAENTANAFSDLQLYEWLPNKSGGPGDRCVKQVSGASVRVRFEPLKQSP
jgi:hypothetical protein